MGSAQPLTLGQDSKPEPVRLGWRRCVTARGARRTDAHALQVARRVLDASERAALEPLAARDRERFVEVMFALCGVAPFLGSDLVRHPDWLPALLGEDLSMSRARDALELALDGRLAADPDAAHALREFKYYELARITVRDCSERLITLENSAETLRALSLLADVLLQRALRVAQAAGAGALRPAALARGGRRQRRCSPSAYSGSASSAPRSSTTRRTST